MINQVAPDLVNISTKEKLVSQSSQQYCQKLNFLFLTTDKYPSERADVVDLFVEEMVQRGHVIDWIQQSKLECIKPYRQKLGAGTVWVAPTDLGMSRIARLKKHLYALQNDLNMFSLARSNGYDFIQVMDRFLPAIMAIAVAKLNKTKFIFWLSFPFPEAYVYMAKEGLARYPSFYLIRGWFFKWILYKVILPAAYHIFVQSEQMKRDMFDMGISEEKITSVPMGVSLSKMPVTGMEESEELLDKKEKLIKKFQKSQDSNTERLNRQVSETNASFLPFYHSLSVTGRLHCLVFSMSLLKRAVLQQRKVLRFCGV